ncbi:MAG TPA: TonB-dependent receptor [Rhodocyclaceae bacterium]
MKRVLGIPASAVCFLMAGMSGAQAQGPEDEEEYALAFGDRATISVVTGSQQPLRRAPAVASVITADDIATMGAVDLDEVMETVPGVHVTRNSIGNTALYTIRGIFNVNNPQVLILQNGVPMTTMFQGNKGGVWGGLPLENVARIEVIRGPGSALYGADAYAGVINIITKTAADTPGTEFGLRAGSFNTQDAWVQHGGKVGDVDVAAYLRFGSTDGFKKNINADAQTARDIAKVTHVSEAPGPMSLGRDAVDASLNMAYDGWRFNAGYKLRDHAGVGAGVASALDPTSYTKSERVNADLTWNKDIAPNLGVGVTASYLHYADTVPSNLLLSPAGTIFPNNASFPNGLIGGPNKWERQYRLSANATYSGFADHNLRFGLGHDDLNLYKTATYKNYRNNANGSFTWTGPVIDYSTIQPFMDPHRRKIDYGYLQDEYRFSRDWTLTAGIRRDLYSDVGDTTNPRVALVWDADANVTAKLLAGRAFRAPSFNELYGINNPVAAGNPNLKPETNSTLEAAVSWQVRRDLQLSVNVFRYRMRDVIRTVGTSLTTATYQNSGDQKGSGMEFEAIWDVSRDVRVTGNLSLQRSVDVATNTDVGYAPHHHLYTRGDWHFMSGWIASAQLDWVAERKRAFGDRRPNVPDYQTVDLTVRTDRGKGAWDFAASIRNVFNANIVEPSLSTVNIGTTANVQIPGDLPQAPRSMYLQAIYSM